MPALGRLADFQCYDCLCCPGCCRRAWIVPVTDAERAAIAGQGWQRELGVERLFAPYRTGLFGRAYRLAQDADGACIFLNPDNGLCRIHERYGFEAKPIACQAYPHVFVPVENRLEVSMRFDCLSVATNHGRTLAEQQAEIAELARRVVGREVAERWPPPVRRGVRRAWSDLRLVAAAFDRIVQDASRPITVRVLGCVNLARTLAEVRLDTLAAKPLRELLDLIGPHAVDEAAGAAEAAPREPDGAARVLFRQLAAIYCRHDRLIDVESAGRRAKGRWDRFRAAVRFAKGRGPVPRLAPGLPEADFDDLDYPLETIPADCAAALTRFVRMQTSSFRFFGAACHGWDLLGGATALAAAYPVLLWQARWFAHGRGRRGIQLADVHDALRLVGHQYAQSPALGTRTERRRIRLLGRDDFLEQLILWYG